MSGTQGNSTSQRVSDMYDAPSFEDYHDDSIGTPDQTGRVRVSVQQKRNMSVNRQLDYEEQVMNLNEQVMNLNEQVRQNDVESKKLSKEMTQQMEMNAKELKLLNKRLTKMGFGKPEYGQTYKGRPITPNIFDNNDNPKDMERFHSAWDQFFNFDDKQKEKKKGDLKF